MDEQTTTIEKKPIDTNNNESRFIGISIRAWLALMVIGTVCAVTIMHSVRAVVIQDYNWSIDGQFWMLVGAIVAHYFKTNDSNNNNKTTNENKDSASPTV